MRKLLLILAGLCFVLAGSSFAFHDAGVAQCNGCHTMHNSEGGVAVYDGANGAASYLLNDATGSDVCLNCHDHGYGVQLGTDPLAPPPEKGGGNFVYLLSSNLNDGHAGASNPISGDRAGHNLNAPGHGLSTDATLSSAPGGSFPASLMSCTSCHDPHGTDEYRILYTLGQQPQDGVPGMTYTAAAPEATAGPSLFFGSEGLSNHNAYVSGMSEWCGNCHGDFHNTSYPTVMRHPSGAALGTSIASVYNLYNGTDDMTGGDALTSYLPEVPFEDAAAATNSTAGPTGASKVMCLSCHRAHASSAPYSGRWDFNVAMLQDDGVESGAYAIPNPYNYGQRSLCNKCHAKDAYDHIPVEPAP
jgi:predicted CXXCH cytochrome family protein